MKTSHHTENTQQASAIRLASTVDMQRDTWLQVRKQGIGASDAAAAVGISPYMSPLELWMIKTGRDAHLPKDDPNDDESPMYWGSILEPIVAKHYTEKSGNKVRRVNAILQHPDNDKSWMLANLDYAVVGNPDVDILECKTAGEWGSKHWKDGVPDYVVCQVQHQLAVTGKQAADVCVLLCGQRIKRFRLVRDETLIENLMELERAFWHYVETDTPPPSDGSSSSGKALQALFPFDEGSEIDLSDDQAIQAKFDALLDVRENLGFLEEREKHLKQAIQQCMGEHTKASFSQGEVIWKKTKDSISLDTKALLVEQPKLKEQFSKTRAGSRRFTIKLKS